jgi:hypothetical protein
LAELIQCHVGTELMLTTLRLLLLVYAHGGSISLEHPMGEADSQEKWCVWLSSFIKWILLGADIRLVSFLQGPLGQCAPKPTTMMVGRLENFATKIYSNYDRRWRPSTFLIGKDEQGWCTARAKVYPPLLSRLIVESHLDHAAKVCTDGHTEIPEDINQAIQALSAIHDPYFELNFMKADYHRGSSGPH